MPNTQLEADYLIIGAGAMGMAFVDEMLTQDKTSTFIIVDRQNRPGGHWNVAYPFVSLHQPSAFYGMNSRELGHGDNRLASHLEIQAYYEAGIKEMVAGGRVQYFPLCEYSGNGKFSPLRSSEKTYSVKVNKRIVNAGHLEVKVPANRPPQYDFDSDVVPVPPNNLAANIDAHENFILIGAGKTAIDSIIYLIDNHVNPDRIIWIKPSESWLYDREQCQTDTFTALIGAQMGASLKAKSMDDFYEIMETYGGVFRISEDIKPTKFRCATINSSELEKCRSIKNVIRLGKVKKIESNQIVFEEGTMPTSSKNMHIDCTANPLTNPAKKAVFEDGIIILQSIFTCQQVFSAALIAYIETNYDNDAKRNAVAGKACWFPEQSEDILRMTLDAARQLILWDREPELQKWLMKSRLFFCSYVPLQEYKSRIAANLNLLKLTGVTKQLRGLYDEHYPNLPFPLDDIAAPVETASEDGAVGLSSLTATNFCVDRNDYSKTEMQEVALPSLQENQIRMKVGRFGLTANNISYALGGDLLSFWDYYPAKGEFGIIPVWGVSEVIESQSPDIQKGERIYGFLPMSNYVTLSVSDIGETSFKENSEHRSTMPPLYNKYFRISKQKGYKQEDEDLASLLRWLFMTSFLLSDQVASSDLDEEQIIIDTASSKTALGTAYCFRQQDRKTPKIIGLTSPGNVDFVKSLGLYDEVYNYDEVEKIAKHQRSVFLNFSGNYKIIRRVHKHIPDDLVTSLNIGLAQWENVDSVADMMSPQPDVPGPAPMPFLLFTRILEIEDSWGEDVLEARYIELLNPFLEYVNGHVSIESGVGKTEVERLYRDVLGKKVTPNQGVILSLS